jgi:hypothetical protein
MKNRIGVLFILATIVVPGIVAKVLSQTGGANSITISSTSGYDSQAIVSGSYTIASGYTFSSILVYVQPTGESGGQSGVGTASIDGSGNFNASVLVPPNTTYDIQACLTVTDSIGNSYAYFSDLATGVYVSNGPPP